MEGLGKMKSTVMSSNIDYFFLRLRCHKRKAEEHAKFVWSQLEESSDSSRKSEEKQDSKGFQ